MQLAAFDLPVPPQAGAKVAVCYPQAADEGINTLLFIQNISATVYSGHDLGSGKVALSFHQKWMASVASDGKLLLRLSGSPVSCQIKEV